MALTKGRLPIALLIANPSNLCIDLVLEFWYKRPQFYPSFSLLTASNILHAFGGLYVVQTDTSTLVQTILPENIPCWDGATRWAFSFS